MLLEKLNKQDIELLGTMHDPISLSEVLFTEKVENFETLKYFDEESFFKVRLYQIPMMSYEYLLANDIDKSENENFEIKKKAGKGYYYCGRKIGKCEWTENICTLASGEQIKFGDLIGKTREVISLDENTKKLVKSRAIFLDNGIRDCYKVTLKSGKYLTVTGNHPLLTDSGWKRATDLIESEFIATPRMLPIEGNLEVNESVAKMLGYLIGDGSCSQSTIGFTNINLELIKEIYSLALDFNCDIRKYNVSYFFKHKEKKHNKNNIQKLVLKYKINKLAKDKEIPKEVYKWKNKYIKLFLNRLFACDAHVNIKQYQIELTLSSKKLVEQISHLLLRFGIQSRISYKKVKFKNKEFDNWRLYILQDFNRFLDIIGIKSKDKGIRRKNSYSTGDRIPHSFLTNIYHKCKGSLLSCNIRKMKLYHSSRNKWQKIALATKEEEIVKIAYSDIYWDIIQKIEYAGKLPTVIVQVTKYRNYISNNIISHNSLVALLLDLFIDTIHNFSDWITAFSSVDYIHLAHIFEPYITIMENHPFFKFFHLKVNRKEQRATIPSGHVLHAVNMTLGSKKPGTQWERLHAHKIVIDEHQYETDEIAHKRSQAVSERGCIAEGSKVLMGDFSVKNIENIQIEDEILGWKKNQFIKTKVLNIFSQGKKDVINIINGNNDLWLTPDHRILCLSEGDKCYKWRPSSGCLLNKYFARNLSYYNNEYDFYKGVLIGLIESDGSHRIFESKKGRTLHQFLLYQSEGKEYKFFKFLLNYFKIPYKDSIERNKTGSFRHNTPLHRINILRENNKFITKAYEDLEKNKDIKYGFICGFIIGDGCVDNNASFCITQSIKNHDKIKYLKKILDHLKIFYSTWEFTKCNKKHKALRISKYNIPFYLEQSKKSKKYINSILNVKRPIFHKSQIKFNGFKKQVKIWDLTTECGNFIANGIIVHNCIERFAGITSFKSHAPAGKIYNDLEKRNWLLNIPETVSPFWNKQRKEEARKDYSGEDSFGYRINVLAEVCENAVGTYDIERVRQAYNYKKTVKSFEIDKIDYSNIKKRIFDMEDKIVVEKPKNVFRVWVGADFGESPAPTEIVVLFEYEQDPDNVFKYIYNITLSRMTPNEQTEIFEYLIAKLSPNFIAIDCTEQGGRQVFRNLEEKFGRENLIWVGFNEKIEVGFEKDAQGHVIYEKGDPKKLYEYITDWSVRRLKTLLYNKKIVIYKDYKFDRQFNAMVSTQSGSRVIYGSTDANHIHQAFQAFAIAQWKNEFNLIKPLQHKKWCKGGY